MWTPLVLFFVTATPLLATWIVFVSVPEMMHTRYRHDLWAIRDAIVDDVIAGDLTLSVQTQRLLRSLYSGIRHAGRHTFRDGLIARACLRHVVPPRYANDVVLGGEGITAAERERLAAYLKRFEAVSARHMVYASPSGWVGSVVLLVAARLGLLTRPDGRSYAEEAASLEIAESAIRPDDSLPRFVAPAF